MSTNLFDLSQEYDAMLNQGIRFSGEDKHFFIRGRIADLRGQLPLGFAPRRILDFGCGIGDSTQVLAHTFPLARITGADTAENALTYAQQVFGSATVGFCRVDEIAAHGPYDLCYVNGVFHHIVPADRLAVVRVIYAALAPGGYFALFENNPWNPGTRVVMRHIPFDHDAQTLPPPLTRGLLRAAGFRGRLPIRSLFYFPRQLAVLRRLEPALARLPLGAQYYVRGVR